MLVQTPREGPPNSRRCPSSPADLETLAARVEKLEAANRRWKSSSVIALLLVISTLLLSTRHAERVAAAAKPDRVEPDVLRVRTVEAQDFVLRDLDGHVYGRLGITPELDGHGPERPVWAPLRRARDTRSGIAAVLRRKGESGLERSEQAAVHNGKVGTRELSSLVNTQRKCSPAQGGNLRPCSPAG